MEIRIALIAVLIVLFSCGNESKKNQIETRDKIKADSLFYKASENITKNQLYQKDDEAALKLLDQAIHLNPLKKEYYLNRGAAKINLLLFTEAIVDLKEVISQDPNNENALLNIALCNNHLEQYDRAIDYATKAIKANSNLGYAYFVRSDSWMSKNNFEEMCKDLNLAFVNNYSPAANRISKFCNKNIKHIKF